MRQLLKYQLRKFRFRLKRHFVDVIKFKTSDRSVALGYALGTFVAILPTPGISVFLGILIVAIFKNVNKVAVFIAMAIWNVWTVIPLYWLSIKIGDLIFHNQTVIHFRFELLNQIFDYTRRFLVGNLVISIPFSILTYYSGRWGLRKFRMHRLKRSEDKKRQR